MSCCTRACLPRTLSSPLRYPVCQPNLESSAERADVLLSDPPSQVAPLVARAGRRRATHRALDVRALCVSAGRVVVPGGTAQSPDQGAAAQDSRDAAEPPVSGCSCRVATSVWLLVSGRVTFAPLSAPHSPLCSALWRAAPYNFTALPRSESHIILHARLQPNQHGWHVSV